jgi:hypothetical protein
MLIIALFAVAAALGATLAVKHFQGQPLPLPLIHTHSAFGAAGLLSLFFLGSSQGFSDLWRIALGIFAVVALGGFALFFIHTKNGKPPTMLLIGHALGALTAFALLLAAAFA